MSKKGKENMADIDAYEFLVAEEELILQAQMLIQQALNEQNLTQKKLAEKLGVGESYISQMLGCSARNLTLRTIARVLKVLGATANLSLNADSLADQTVRGNWILSSGSAHPHQTPSDVWGEVVPMEPRKKGARRKGQHAEDFASFDPPAIEMALAA